MYEFIQLQYSPFHKKENVLKHPRPFKVCQHNENQKEWNLSDKDEELCPTVEELKYKLVSNLILRIYFHWFRRH